MNSITAYLKASYEELLTKVTWPTWKDLQANAIIVGVAAFIIALIIGLMDMVSHLLFSEVIYKITG